MLGTAFPAARLLLVEEPFPWGSEGLRTSLFDTHTALALEARCRAETVRVQAIRRPGRRADRAVRRWALVDTRADHRTIHWGEFSDDADLLDLPLDGSAGEPDPEPLYLVCTHGKHDPCCAQRGRPLTVALDALRPGRVWQASHLGGCRFAPTLLILPTGLMYGRVPPASAVDVVAATDAHEVIVPLLRGHIGWPPAAQAAVGFAQAQLGSTGGHDIWPTSITQVDWGTVVVRVATPQGAFDITIRRERVDTGGLTCGTPGASWFVAHHLGSIEPVAAV